MPRRKRSASPFELMDDDFDDTSSQSSRNGNPPIQRNAANARERARMRVLSSAFGRLKTKLPNIPADTKLSKLDTLRLATMYIKQLKSVVEGGAQIINADGDSSEGSLNNNSSNSLTSCFINLNSGTQSMNWPFGFHHHHHFQHLSNNSTARSSTSSSMLSLINGNNTNSFGNWCQSENNNNNNEQIKILRYNNSDNYPQNEQQKPHQPHYQDHTHLPHAIMDHENSNRNQQQHYHQHTHWYSETPSPELDTSSSNTCLIFENDHLLCQQEQQHPHHHILAHLQPASLHSSSVHVQHDFHNHQLQRHQHHNDQHQQSSHNHTNVQNGFTNASNLQSTSIR